MVIYLKHPVHGTKVAIGQEEAAHDRLKGWEDYDPVSEMKNVTAVELPSDAEEGPLEATFVAEEPVVEKPKRRKRTVIAE